MSDKKIFIALSQREARSVITAINFLTNVCLKDSGNTFEVKHENAAAVGITAEELSELFNFGYRLGELADEQAELESSNLQPVTCNLP
jgi:urease accessory protein UreE